MIAFILNLEVLVVSVFVVGLVRVVNCGGGSGGKKEDWTAVMFTIEL